MPIREGTITTNAINDLIRSAKIIMKDAMEDGASRADAWKYIKKLAAQGAKQSR